MNEDIKLQNIQQSIISKTGEELKTFIVSNHPYDIHIVIEDLDLVYQKKVIDLLDPSEAADILEYLEIDTSVNLLISIDPKKAAKIVSMMEIDDAVDIIKIMSKDKKITILKFVDKTILEKIVRLSKYAENEAGSIVTDNYLYFTSSMKAGEAMKKLVKEASDREEIDVLFVVNSKGELIGYISLNKLIVARKNDKISDIMDTNVKSIDAQTSIYDAVEMINEYNLLALPVLKNGILKGIITLDDVMDYVSEDISADYAKLAGISGEKADTSLKNVLKSRLLWLVILLILSFFVSSVMTGFSQVITAMTSLVFFQSLVLGMGGNASTQALATTVIGLSKGAFADPVKRKRHIRNEIIAGFINAFILAVVAFWLSYIFINLRHIEGNSWIVSLIVGLSIMAGLFISNIIGTLVPIIFSSLHIDPAVASGPFISTLNDIIGVLIYYSLATLILMGGGFL